MKASLFYLSLILFAVPALPSAEPGPIEWQPWSDTIFEKAKKENRFVLLDLEAVWCHWCHVMDEITYQDPKVVELIRSRYIAVKVDQDSRPDLANRYEDYGWPGTIVFGPDGQELVKRQGYIPPKPMASMLQAIIDDPTPGPSIFAEPEIEPNTSASLNPELAGKLRTLLVETYDPVHFGWGSVHKFLDWDTLEFCMAEPSGSPFEKMGKETLGAQRALLDPVWGGVYQYSTDGDWQHPHFEKLMQFQAENLRIYSEAYLRWGDSEYLAAAKSIRKYILDFLRSPDGAFYTSQDADVKQGEHSEGYFALNDAARRKAGLPRVDTHIYSRENGWAIQAMVAFYRAGQDDEALQQARQAANWIIQNRSLPNGGFRHDEKDAGGPYLGDTLSMGRAFLALYAATGERDWLKRASEAASFIADNFKVEAGYATAVSKGPLASEAQLDENIALARFANLLTHYSGEAKIRELADHAMRCVTAPQWYEARGYQVAGALLADAEFRKDPLHVTIVGAKENSDARALFVAAGKLPGNYKQIEWFDAKEGALPGAEIEYPVLEKPAAFRCSNNRCSSPAFTADAIFKMK